MTNRLVKLVLAIGTIGVLTTSCSGSRVARAQEIKADLALREMRSQIEEFKYQLNKYEVELQIVESKADSQNTSLSQVRQDISKLSKNDQQLIESTFASYDKKFERVENLEQTLKKDLVLLKDQTNELLSSLAQFKKKLDNNEGQIFDQQRYIEHLKTSLEAIMKVVQQPTDADGVFYTVSPGDSLDKIAKQNNTSVSVLKDLNNISGEVIVVGQKIRLK